MHFLILGLLLLRRYRVKRVFLKDLSIRLRWVLLALAGRWFVLFLRWVCWDFSWWRTLLFVFLWRPVWLFLGWLLCLCSTFPSFLSYGRCFRSALAGHLLLLLTISFWQGYVGLLPLGSWSRFYLFYVVWSCWGSHRTGGWVCWFRWFVYCLLYCLWGNDFPLVFVWVVFVVFQFVLLVPAVVCFCGWVIAVRFRVLSWVNLFCLRACLWVFEVGCRGRWGSGWVLLGWFWIVWTIFLVRPDLFLWCWCWIVIFNFRLLDIPVVLCGLFVLFLSWWVLFVFVSRWGVVAVVVVDCWFGRVGTIFLLVLRLRWSTVRWRCLVCCWVIGWLLVDLVLPVGSC